MPRVHYRKARKDYPAQGIAKGEMYYTAKIKQQRGGITLRSKTPLKPSQLTTSAFKSAYLAAQETWDESGKEAEDIRAAAEAIRDAGQEAQGSFDNMPEGLQQGETGQMLEERANQCESKADELEGLADEMDQLEEPEEADFDQRPEDAAEDEDPDLVNGDGQTYDEVYGDYENELTRIRDEADSLIEDMPE
jgi:hypothetical protein